MATPENPNARERLVYMTVPVSERLARYIDAIAHDKVHREKRPYDPPGMLREILETGIQEINNRQPAAQN